MAKMQLTQAKVYVPHLRKPTEPVRVSMPDDSFTSNT
jgi:hypothetical protein